MSRNFAGRLAAKPRKPPMRLMGAASLTRTGFIDFNPAAAPSPAPALPGWVAVDGHRAGANVGRFCTKHQTVTHIYPAPFDTGRLLLQLRQQRRNGGEQILVPGIVGDLEDGRLFVVVDGHDAL